VSLTMKLSVVSHGFPVLVFATPLVPTPGVGFPFFVVSRLVFALCRILCRCRISVATLGVGFHCRVVWRPGSLIRFIWNPVSVGTLRRWASVFTAVSYGVPGLLFALFGILYRCRDDRRRVASVMWHGVSWLGDVPHAL
jgi:hypothetical protein